MMEITMSLLYELQKVSEIIDEAAAKECTQRSVQ